MKVKVNHLSCREADRLLNETGIPCDEIDRYKTTIVAGNIYFWDQLLMQDRAGLLVVKNNRILRARKPQLTEA